MADPHWSPPQELRAATLIGLVGMRATALRAHLLNSALSLRRSGACDKFNLLISARMGVGRPRRGGHKKVVLQTDAQFGRSIDDGQIFEKSSSRVSVTGSRLAYYYWIFSKAGRRPPDAHADRVVACPPVPGAMNKRSDVALVGIRRILNSSHSSRHGAGAECDGDNWPTP